MILRTVPPHLEVHAQLLIAAANKIPPAPPIPPAAIAVLQDALQNPASPKIVHLAADHIPSIEGIFATGAAAKLSEFAARLAAGNPCAEELL